MKRTPGMDALDRLAGQIDCSTTRRDRFTLTRDEALALVSESRPARSDRGVR